jgi:hypothetical protein
MYTAQRVPHGGHVMAHCNETGHPLGGGGGGAFIREPGQLHFGGGHYQRKMNTWGLKTCVSFAERCDVASLWRVLVPICAVVSSNSHQKESCHRC